MQANQVKRILKTTLRFLGILRIRRAVIRKKIVDRYLKKQYSLGKKWVWKNTEYSNFYYDLTETNMNYLAEVLSFVCKVDSKVIISYFDELSNDSQLRLHIQSGIRKINEKNDIKVFFGRRYAWYAVARAIKPKLVIETGVEHGVGSCILSSALLRNSGEGFPGRYIGTEIKTTSGILYTSPYTEVGEIVYGDSIQTLNSISSDIDLFINDSDHSPEYEYHEYLEIQSKIRSNSVLLGDNSHTSEKLLQFSKLTARKFLYFSENPKDHWYPGGGIGFSFE
jgi:hypothetical protein